MASMEGSLSKWTNVMKGWQYRWFVLDDNAGILSYYTSREKMMRGVRRGCVRLKGAVIGIDDEDDSTFTITVDSKTFHFQARDGEEREKWVRCLEDTILRHAYGYKSTGSLRLDSASLVKPSPTIQDFDKKLAEADGYLQILIDQTKALELRVQPMSDADDKARCEAILNHANNMLEQVKHTIVLLQIAKNTAFPVNGTYQPVSVSDSSPKAISPGSISLNLPSDVQQGIELGSDCTEARILAAIPLQCPPLMQVYGSGLSSRPHRSPAPHVPETSYSSSEEEDFFDANDTSDPTNSPSAARRLMRRCCCFLKRCRCCCKKTEPLAYEAGGPSVSGGEMPAERQRDSPSTPTDPSAQRPSTSNFLKSDGTLDYDALYEDPNESDISMEAQGSVVTHLLSQVKIGMDLTKVVLPTFILERRSLLEMYADYFAHPDMFVKIADLESERDRMVQVVRWYMASYHAGRKSAVAKKPYNPVLGEVFKCYWNVPNLQSSSQPEVTDGPVPWCHRDQLTFVAEQVSHHPPISAFYAEHYNKQISCQAYIWTKSKFLGLSIGVHNIGKGIVQVLKYNEEYTCTFPNGYGRSILTVPWIELGGSVLIECEKTGYHANIEFLTKPFYGGKKHRVTAEVFGPQDKKPFLSIAGEWNGVMDAKWADGRSEQFINVDSLPIVKKIVRPIEQQKDNESRRLWKEVTAGLRLNNVAHATNSKSEIEQRQRIEAQRRKEAGVSWQTKLFIPETGDQWVFTNPLEKRINVNR